MALSITNNSKNSVSITNASKPSGQTWDDMNITWDEATGTWDQPGTPVIKDTKNTVTISNTAKS